MNALVAAPFLCGLLAGTVALVAPARARRALLVAGATLHLLAALALAWAVHDSGTLALHLGGWEAPLGIALVADPFAVVMVVLSGVLGLPVAWQMARVLPDEEFGAGTATLVPFLLAGVDAAFLTADLFHLYVAFEVLLMASFVLLVAGRGRSRHEATQRYLLPGVLSSMLLLAGVGAIYGLTGTLYLPEIADRVSELGDTPAVRGVACILALAFGLKAAVFPVAAWLPASYPAAPPPTVALFSGLLGKVGVYALVRVFTLVFPVQLEWLGPALVVVAGATMVAGVLAALAQWDMRGLLTFHVVSQVGYLIVGPALGTKAALAATVFYLFHNSVAKCALLLGTGVVRARRGTDRLKELGGLVSTDPWLAGLFLVAALALAGIPPLSGFWAKLLVLRAAVDVESWALLGVAAGVGVLTLLSMSKIWTTAFWGTVPETVETGRRERLGDLVPVALLVVVAVGLGLFAGPAITVADTAADALLDTSGYRAALAEARP